MTGTNGKTTTVQMVNAILNRAGYASVAVGNIGVPMAEAIFLEPQPQVFVVELSSYQLHFTQKISAHTSRLFSTSPLTTSTGTVRSTRTARQGTHFQRHPASHRLQPRRCDDRAD